MAFLKISAKIQAGYQIGWQTVEEVVCKQANTLMDKAVQEKIVAFWRDKGLL
jgi:hypothetical protein